MLHSERRHGDADADRVKSVQRLAPPWCKAAFSLLSCRSVGEQLFLDADLDVSCASPEYFAWGYGLGVPSLLAYGVGVPLYYWRNMLALRRKNELEANRAVYGFLFSGYESERWWFELWNSVRKALFMGLSILLIPLGPAMQAWGALLLLVLFLVVFLRATPYREGWLNALERDALSVDALTLFLGVALFLNDTNTGDAKSEGLAITLSLFVVAINVWFVIRVVRSLKSYSAYGGALRQRAARLGRRLGRGAVMLRRRWSRRGSATENDDGSQVDVPNPYMVEMKAAASL